MAHISTPGIHGIDGSETLDIITTPDGHPCLLVRLEDGATLQVHPISADGVTPQTQTRFGLAALEIFAETLLATVHKAQADL